jgi:hypothetical protein
LVTAIRLQAVTGTMAGRLNLSGGDDGQLNWFTKLTGDRQVPARDRERDHTRLRRLGQ